MVHGIPAGQLSDSEADGGAGNFLSLPLSRFYLARLAPRLVLGFVFGKSDA